MPSQIMPTVNLLKLPDPAARTAKFVNMMNATKRQEAEERQADIAQKTFVLKEEEGKRQVETQTSNMRKADLDYKLETAKRLRNLGVTVYRTKDPARQEAAYQSWLGMVDKADSEAASLIRQASDTYDADIMLSLLMETDKFIDKSVTTPVTSLELGVDGSPRSVDVGGLYPQQRSVYDVSETPNAAPMTPVPTAAPQQTTPGPVPKGKFGEDRVIPDNAVPLTDFEQEDIRRIKEGSGMTNTPASFTPSSMGTPTAGRMSPDMVPAIIDSAMKTGVMAQIDLDQMLAMTPPQARQGIVDVLRSNNVSLQADAPSLAASAMNQQQPMAPNPVQRPPSQFADMRGPAPQASFADLGGQPQMQNTMAQTQPRTSTKLQQRNPNVSPYPGSAQVPLSRVAAEAAVQRETPEQAAAKTAATARATATVETEKKNAEKLPGRKQVSTLINKVRAAYEQLEKAEAIPSETRGGFANAMDYFGTSSLGREAQKMVGTKSSKYLSEIINSRKLLATAIKNATGMSAQEMNSNVELQLTLDALTDPTQGIEAARTTLATLEELYGAPRTAAPAAAAPRAAAKTSVIPDAAKQMLRKNPSPQQRAMFDRVFGKGAAAKVLGQR